MVLKPFATATRIAKSPFSTKQRVSESDSFLFFFFGFARGGRRELSQPTAIKKKKTRANGRSGRSGGGRVMRLLSE